MNYEFSEKEFTFLIELHEMLTSAVGEKDLENGSEAMADIKVIIGQLARTPYLKFGIEPVPELDGMTLLMGAMEVVSAVSPSLYLTTEYSTRVFGRALSEWGSDAQKAKWLKPLVEGKMIGALALCEESVNMDSQRVSTRGEKTGGQVTVNGQKQYVVNAPAADCIGVVGILDDQAAVFVIEKDSPGLVVEAPVRPFGFTGAAISAIRLENCSITEDQVIVPGGKTDLIAQLRFWENQVIIGAGLGLMKSAYEAAKAYAKSHRSGGKPIIAYQEIGFKLAEMLTHYQSAQLLALRTAWTADNIPKEAESLTWCAKVFCTESAEIVAGEALRILGASGYTQSNPAERAYRCAKYGQIFGTSTEVARVKIGDAAMGGKV